MADAAPFEGWCLLELMGHRRLAGFVQEATVAGAGFVRIDVPGDDGNVATQYYAPGAVYAITPITEELARRVARANRPEPVTRWELPPAVEARRSVAYRLDGAPIDDTDEDDGCPVNDPACTSRDDERHDACERPPDCDEGG